MGGKFALGPEFLARGNEADTKEFFPKPIHGYAAGQWVFLIHQPLGQIQTGRLINAFGGRKKGNRETSLDLISPIQVGTTKMNERLAALVFGKLAKDRNGRSLDPGKLLFQILEFFSKVISGGGLIDLGVCCE